MNATAAPANFLHVPSGLLSSVRRALAGDREPMEAVTLLRQVGYETGEGVYDALLQHVRDRTGSDPLAVDPDRFWELASGYFQALGWGRVAHRQAHPALGQLELLEWMEMGSEGGPPGAHLSTGLFTDLLIRMAGGAPVTVMEVPAGPGRTRLLFGSAEALGAVYAAIQGGATPDEAVAALG